MSYANKVFGKYRAKVTKVDKGTGKVRVECKDIYGKYESPWCTACIPFIEITSKSETAVANGHSHKITIQPKQHEIDLLPKVGNNVWIEFEQGDVNKPIWCGTWV